MTYPRAASLLVQIAHLVDDHFIGVIACVLINADGKRHACTENVPVVSADNFYVMDAQILDR